MKKFFLFSFVAIVCFFKPVAVFSVDMEVAIQLDNFGIKDNGNPKGYIPDFGFDVFVSGNFTDMVGASFMLQRTPNIGNMIKPRIIFETQNMGFQIGPSLGILNFSKNATNTTEISTIQPGFGVGMNVNIDNGFFAKFDIDFSLATGTSNTNIFLNNGIFEIGMRTRNALVSLKLLQFTRTVRYALSGDVTLGLTDIGLFFEVFSKGSNFRFPFACIFKLTNFQDSTDDSKNRFLGNIALEAGITHQIYNDLTWFCKMEVGLPPLFGSKGGEGVLYKFRGGCNFTIN